MSEVETKVARGGARAARRAARTAPLPDNLRPVRPGMTGGRYKPLSESDVLRIHHAALDVLENIGLADATPGGIEYITGAGARLNSQGRLIFPRALVEDTVARAARHFVLHGQDPKHDMEPWGSRVLVRHGGRRRAHRRRQDRCLPGFDHQGLVRHRAGCRYAGASAFLSAFGGVPRGRDPAGNGHQHRLRQRGRHHEACRHELGPASARRGQPRDVSPDGGRRGQMACAPIRQPVQLLRGAAAQVRL